MFLCLLCGCHNIILNLPWPISVSFTMWVCPLALRWIDGKFHSEASVLISQPSDPLKEKEFLAQILACHLLLCESCSPQKDQRQEGNTSHAVKFNFSHLLFSVIFSHFCIDLNALNSVTLVLNLNDYSKTISSSEQSKGISYLHALRHGTTEAEIPLLSILLIIFIMEEDKCLI